MQKIMKKHDRILVISDLHFPYHFPEVFAFLINSSLKKGNLDGVPSVKVTNQETSANDWDAIKFNFQIKGN